MADTKKDLDDIVQKYEKDILGLPDLKKVDCSKYIEFSHDEIKSMSIDQIQCIVFDLTKYMFYVNRVINKEKAWKRLVESKIEEVSACVLKDIHDDVGWSGKLLLAKHSESTKPYHKVLKEIVLKIESMDSLPKDIQRVIDVYRDIMFEKIRKAKEQ